MKIRSSLRSHNLSILLSIWVYIYAIFYFVPLIIRSHTLLMYFVLLALAILTLFNTITIRRSLVIFIACYLALVLINIIAVSYPYYVALDALSGLAVFLPALLTISSHFFNLIDFSYTWFRAAIFSTIITPLAIILMQKKYIDYGVFTYLNLPNAIIFSYIALITKRKDMKNFCYLLALLNFVVILLLGGRMAAFAAAFTILASYLLSQNTKFINKASLFILLIFVSILVLFNLDELLYDIQNLLTKYNLKSRSIALLIEQLKTHGTSVYLSGRNIVYNETLNYISSRYGLPGGFGVSLAVTDGKYYHPHNLVLQLSAMLGIYGMIIFLFLIIIKISSYKKSYKKKDYQFVTLLLLDYFVISLTGGSILTNYAAIIGIGMLFFYQPNRIDYNI